MPTVIISYLLALIGFATGVIAVLAAPRDSMTFQSVQQDTRDVLGIQITEAPPLPAKPREILGFQPYWLVGKSPTDDMPSYLTTYSYFGLHLDPDGTLREFENPGEREPGWQLLMNNDTFQEQLTLLKDNDVTLSLLIHNLKQDEIEELLEYPEENARTFIEEVTPIMKQHGFTDLNIDIESVALQPEESRDAFIQFMEEVRNGVNENNLGTLGIDLIAKSLVEPHLTDVTRIAPLVDYIVLMTYDFHYMGSAIAGPVAPLTGVGVKREYDVETTVKEATKYVPREKIYLGIPFYGYGWDTLSTTPGSAVVKGTGRVVTHKQAQKILHECDDDCITGVDKEYLQPYIIFPDDDGNGEYYRQIFYEDEQSLALKLDLVERYDLGGVAIWALGYEEEGMREVLREYKEGMGER